MCRERWCSSQTFAECKSVVGYVAWPQYEESLRVATNWVPTRLSFADQECSCPCACHGCRLVIPDDFSVQFNHTNRKMRGVNLPPYRYNASARASFGHAALIVGYNNTDFTFTILNSWGSGANPVNPRLSGGTTADGMFKVNMGLLGKRIRLVFVDVKPVSLL